jgi:arginyl-tRNA synthetase
MMRYMNTGHPEQEIRQAIDRALLLIGVAVTPYAIEHPGDMTHGDYASNVAMAHAKHAGMNPRVLAESIQNHISGTLDMVKEISIAGPGFLNFTLKREYFASVTQDILSNTTGWGRHDTLKGSEVLFEYTSPNLFKPLHVGNLVGNIVGESLSRLMENAGAIVHRINYPSDIGLTVAKAVWGLTSTSGNPDNILDLGRAYVEGNRAYEEGGDRKIAIEAINRALYLGEDETLMTLRRRGIQTSLARLDELCRILGTSFDTVFFESEVGPIGKALVEKGKAEHVFQESEGAVVYKGEKAGLHTRVFLNAQGLPTYEAKDLGNFQKKCDAYPNWTHSMVVTGNEQSEYFKVVFAAIKELFPEARTRELIHIPTGFLTLSTGKMSSRLGNVLTGESLIEELRAEAYEKAVNTRAKDVSVLADMIAVAALKYQILRQKVGGDMIFDKAQALSFEGDAGPYIQYTHARASSLLRTADERQIAPSCDAPIQTPYELERYLYRFPEVTLRAQEERSPHYLTTYLTELSAYFNAFYAHERIAEVGDSTAPYKIALTLGVKLTLARGLELLGMSAPSEM